ncbi:hypothetical protein CCP3SC15_2450004 [Gammaproteobacteria bacterium]
MDNRSYDIVLCDYNLGDGRDGMQILEEAKQRHLIGLTTVFVMITAESSIPWYLVRWSIDLMIIWSSPLRLKFCRNASTINRA